jgi:hypothetical protein
LKKTTCNETSLKALARRLAKETGFSAAEIKAMPFSEMVWWLTD